MPWNRFRRILAVGTFLVSPAFAPTSSQAQLTVMGACVPGSMCDMLRFSLLWSDPEPVSLYTLSLGLIGASWGFTGAGGDPVNAADSFGAFPGAVLSSATPSSVLIHFVPDPNHPFQVGFELFDFAPLFLPQGYVDLGVAGVENSTFAFVATDAAGVQFTGMGAIDVGVVPEPVSFLLLATGLLGVGAARRRSQRRVG